MATKTFCDACGKELKYPANKYEYLCHLDDLAAGKFMNGFVDMDGNSVSRRSISLELCNKCYNEVMLPSVMKLKEIQKEHE